MTIDFEQMLVDAWLRVSARVRRERLQALKRSRRALRPVLKRPLREMCIVVRAADTRINERSALIEPHEAYQARQEHLVTLDGGLIRHVTKPVWIDWPGVTYEKAAEICGCDYMTVARWALRGVFQVDRYAEHGFPREGKGRRCRRPYVWTPGAIDVNACECRPPHPVWTSVWRGMWEQIPNAFAMTVQRVPRFRMHRGVKCFRGWVFICPGRLDEQDRHKPCGRRCKYLFAPQTLWTIPRWIDDMSGFDMPADSGLAGQWVPGEFDASKATGPRSFACRECWGVRHTWMAGAEGWNEFIAHMSAGLLYGREVPRPPEFAVEPKRFPKRGPKAARRTKRDALMDSMNTNAAG
jgi:hypothetical protein